jgi:hypothetical protein
VGFLAEPMDYLDLAQWIMTLLSRRELRREMGEKAYQCIVAGPYSWQRIAEKFKGVYEHAQRYPLKREDLNPDQVDDRIKHIETEAKGHVPPGLFDWRRKS